MKYKKEIEITSTGMVIAKVVDEKGSAKGLEFFSQFISTNSSVERSCKKAHAWANERIAVCERQET